MPTAVLSRGSHQFEERSVAGALCQICDDLDNVRDHEPPNSALSMLHVVAGMHCGSTLLCNAGTKRSDFTLLGDSINTCARSSYLAAARGAVAGDGRGRVRLRG